ncbi:MAG TPA: DUF3551 domain-containing protein [Bradyrhizobium sp.]|nr:DUF3551 domain-containing protein [Bradyrhizobium sp.]
MRILFFAALAGGAVFAAAPASAQTYDPSYPVCMKVSGDPTYFECHFTSMQQCKDGVRGMSAECVANPYAAAREPAAADRKPRTN